MYDHTGGSKDALYHNDMFSFSWDTGGSNITFDGNVFNYWPNQGSAIMSSAQQGSSLSNWRIENNYFGTVMPGGQYGNTVTYGQGTCSGTFYYRNNTVASGASYFVNTTGCTPTIDFSGNIGLKSGYGLCSNTGTQTGGHNVFVDSSSSGNCGSSNKTCTPAWLNGAPSVANNFDIRLSPSDTCAKDAGNAASYSATDAYRTPRPQGSTARRGCI